MLNQNETKDYIILYYIIESSSELVYFGSTDKVSMRKLVEIPDV